ncbi:efflux RND transporter permease subunit [Nereida sp. MMG025]|uniref:efflux RND transporter permease subunit n=1 Tax=Nereida sp. MMG025 TaxID=2909981 RepID=UPI001F00BC05|nr:multidrug efflux RND transporter permease subunit [Nereida sp. MMG025]MCF6446031.1 multidrug efflux RND transporter permease subunit [Nereida sp. MMG025]
MSPSRLFVDRPVFATVLSIIILVTGIISYFTLPVSEYPEITPPTITVNAFYPGASAETVAETVAAPLEQEINGVDGMIYMLSQSTGDGAMAITISFEPGIDIDAASVQVQNRVTRAEPGLPEPVRRLGVTVEKSSNTILTIVNIISPDESRDQLYLSNYARTQVVDRLARIEGVGNAQVFAERAFSMRVWLDPDRVAARGMTPGDVVAALAENNAQVASGTIGQLPLDTPSAFQFSVQTAGRLTAPEEFENIVVRRGEDGRITRVSDIGRVELGAQSFSIAGYQNTTTSIPVAIFQQPGSNALATTEAVIAEIEALSASFPEGLEYNIVYNPTEFIAASIDAVYETIIEAVLLVILVIVLFLQSWRASIIPVLSIPISLIGTFALLYVLGFSLNTLTLFGLVLAIGIVVDDAIVVVENVERFLREGLSPKEAARRTMDEVGSALVAIGLVLGAVFVPAAFVTGVTGAFYSQFALTIVSATTISVFVSLTLSPALSGVLMRRPVQNPKGVGWLTSAFSNGFNAVFDRISNGYAALTRLLIRISPLVLLIYVGLIALTVVVFMRTPTGFIPAQDKGYFIAALQLPPGSALPRTQAALEEITEIALEHPGVRATTGFAGFDGATFTATTNGAAIFVSLEPFEERIAQGHTIGSIINDLQGQVAAVDEAMVFLLQPPPVDGLGNSGGWTLYLQDRQGRGIPALEAQLGAFAGALNQDPAIASAFSLFNAGTPRIFADIDREKAEILNVRPSAVNEMLEIYLGSAYVNDFTFLGRNFQVTAQADAAWRDDLRDIANYRVRSETGAMVPMGSVAEFDYTTGPNRVPRYNLFTAAEVQGDAAPGVSSTDALNAIEALADQVLAEGYEIEWTGLSFQERNAGNTSGIVFALAVVFVFLVLAALYESWVLPFAVILIVPMCLLAAMVGVNIRGLDNSILTQIGLIVLIALAAKNAILIVEFARKAEMTGTNRIEAAVEAARLRLRPILMTSLAFILGVIPLVIASGAGFEARQALGTAVFAGMIGVTGFGLLLTPVFYVACRTVSGWFNRSAPQPTGV